METGQMNMMQIPDGATMSGTLPVSSSSSAMPGVGNQSAGVFAGLLNGMASQVSGRETATSVAADKGVAVAEKKVGDVVAAPSEMLAGAMAALFNMVGTPLPVGMGCNAEISARTTGDISGELPQNVAMDTAGLQSALVGQLNIGRMPVLDDTGVLHGGAAVPMEVIKPGEVPTKMAQAEIMVAQQLAQDLNISDGQGSALMAGSTDAGHVVAADIASIAEGTQTFAGSLMLVDQLNTGRMPAANDMVLIRGGATAQVEVQMTGALSTRTQQVEFMIAPVMKGTSAGASPAQQPEQNGKEAKPETHAAAMKLEFLSPGQGTSGTAPVGDQKATTIGNKFPASEQLFRGNEIPEAGIKVSSDSELRAQQQHAVTWPRSTAVEVALAESVPRGGASSGLVEKAVPSQTGQVQDIHPAKPAVMSASVPLPLKAQSQPNQTMTAADVRSSNPLGETRRAPVSIVIDAARTGMENRAESIHVRPDQGTVEKPMESVAADVTKLANIATPEKEFGSGDEKGAADQFKNGQFYPSQIHQQGKTGNAGTVNSAPLPVQSDASRPDLSNQIASQVRDRLANHEAKPGNEQIVLRLSPENLGDLKLNLSLEGQRLKVEIVAENRMVRDALLQHTDSLKESLARQNISMESFDVTTNGRGAGNPGQGQQGDWRELARQKQYDARMSADGFRQPDASLLSSQLAYQTSSEHGMVDLHF